MNCPFWVIAIIILIICEFLKFFVCWATDKLRSVGYEKVEPNESYKQDQNQRADAIIRTKTDSLMWHELDNTNTSNTSSVQMNDNSLVESAVDEVTCDVTREPLKKKSKVKIKSIDEMTGREFEFFCAEYLGKNGFSDVSVTRESGDSGADIIASDRYGVRWAFQCKRKKEKVGPSAVQEVFTAKAHYHAEKAAVMTNSDFTEAAKRLAKENDVFLYPGEVLKNK